jgi:poly(3-hydroxybutyrate) depolymerase
MLALAVIPSCLALAVLASDLAGQTPEQVAAVVGSVWTLDNPHAAAGTSLNTSADFDLLYRGLQEGPTYSAVDDGIQVRSWTDHRGVEFRYAVMVPAGYDPETSYPVHVFLHGGIMRALPDPGDRWWSTSDRMIDSTRIAVFPLGWKDATWWGPYQAVSLATISHELRREFNVDENRFYLIGISDGGTGVYFHAFRESTLWAGFLAYIGHPAVLNNPRADTDGDLFVTNMTNRPLFAVNGEVDRLYPTEVVAPYMERFREAGVDITFRPQAGGGHDMRWVPGEAENIRTFIRQHPRDPLPDRMSWETERTDRYQRHHWVILTELGEVAGEAEFPPSDVFPRRHPSGRVDLERRGNTVVAMTRGVRRFTLLLSPDQFDFSQPIMVMTNGVTVFEGVVEKDVDVLLKWAARDRDRTMLFAAEMEVAVSGLAE